MTTPTKTIAEAASDPVTAERLVGEFNTNPAPQEVRGYIFDMPEAGICEFRIMDYRKSRERIMEQMARAMSGNVYAVELSGENANFQIHIRALARAALTAIEPKENK